LSFSSIKDKVLPMHAINVQSLKKTYANGVEALKGVDIVVEEGDFFGLLGANGAGKTTLIGVLCSLVTKTSGEAKIFGHSIDTEGDLAKVHVGVVPQEFNFNIFEKVWDILITQAGYYGLTRAQAAPRAEELLKALGLWDKRDQKSMTLSGGMKRRLMIARALVHDPKLLILDEPTAGVDVELRHQMWEYLTALNKKGVTILLTTHYLEEVEKLCRNVAIIHKGTLVKQGKIHELLATLETRGYVLTLDKTDGLLDAGIFDLKIKDPVTIEVTLRGHQNISEVTSELVKRGRTVIDIRPLENQLERLFLDAIKT